MSYFEDKEEMSSYQSASYNKWRYENGVHHYRRIFPQLVAANKRLWNKIELADQVKSEVEAALQDGRLAFIAVDEQPLHETNKIFDAYVKARACLPIATYDHKVEDLEGLIDPSLDVSDQFILMIEVFHRVKNENDLLADVSRVADLLRSDPLALVLWYQRAGR